VLSAGEMSRAAFWRRLLTELLGSAFLAAVAVGSGIAAQRLSPGMDAHTHRRFYVCQESAGGFIDWVSCR
jgi:hypothetical protein